MFQGYRLRIQILGAGSWGAAIAAHLFRCKHDIFIWHRNQEELEVMEKDHSHPFLAQLIMPTAIYYSSVVTDLFDKDIIVVAVPSHAVRTVVSKFDDWRENHVIVNLAKGIENVTLQRMSEVIHEVTEVSLKNIVTISGPSHAEEVVEELPTAVVAGCIDTVTAKLVQDIFSTETFRVYTNQDIVGVELGGAIKNVIALASGVCDGIGFGDNTKAALITRGIAEISRLGVAMGAQQETFAGLSGIGDLVATCLSQHSRNRRVGQQIAEGMKLNEVVSGMKMVAEGVKTTVSVRALSEKLGVEMPICNSVYDVLFGGKDPRNSVNELMNRELTAEIQ